MKQKTLVIAMACALSTLAVAGQALAHPEGEREHATVKSVEFIGMPAPSTPSEKADVYTTAQVKVTFQNGKSRTDPMGRR